MDATWDLHVNIMNYGLVGPGAWPQYETDRTRGPHYGLNEFVIGAMKSHVESIAEYHTIHYKVLRESHSGNDLYLWPNHLE